jgi:hypothetical protein
MSNIATPAEDAARVYEEAWKLIEEKRATCLWFLDKSYRPVDAAGIARAMRYIERYGDREGYKRARGIRAWLSRISSGTSAD